MARMARALIAFALIAGLLANVHGASASSPNVVISGIFAGGGLAGAPYTNDYIELFNRSSSAVALTGWTVEWESGSTAFSGGSALSGTIAAHAYYLIGEASGGANGVALPTPNATGSTDIGGSTGKARVLDNTSAVVDLVGYFSDEFETNSFSGSMGNGTSLERKRTGCVDSDNNNSDFEFVEPAVAHNSASPTNLCSDNAPVLDPIGNKTFTTLHPVGFTVTASDPDDDQLTFSATNLPTGSSFDESDTHAFTWTPTAGQEGSYPNVHFAVSDGLQTDSEDITITVNTGTNGAPVWDALPDVTTHAGASLSIPVNATDPDGDPVSYSVVTLPGFVTLDDETRSLVGSPSDGDVGTYTGNQLSASDPYVSTNSPTFTITVDPDSSPVLDPIGAKSAHPGATLSFQVSASDPESDPLTFSASNLPSGASFDTSTQMFSWTPTDADIGAHPSVHFAVADTDNKTDSEDITITVSADAAPVMDAVGNRTTHAGGTLSFQVSASDSDSDPLTFSASNLPTGASFDTSTATFSWTPTTTDVGSYPGVTFTVKDPDLKADSDTIQIDVVADQAPVFGPMPNRHTRTNHVLRFTVTATDPDGDPVTFSASALPGGAHFDPVTGVFRWRPRGRQHGAHAMTFLATDGTLTSYRSITIFVRPTTR